MDLFRKRYCNLQIIIFLHINALVKFPTLSEYDEVSELQKLFDEINSHLPLFVLWTHRRATMEQC